MLFDTDKAGESATVRSLDLLIEEGMNVKVATLAAGEDPELLGQLAPKGHRQIGHLLELFGPLVEHPSPHLPGPRWQTRLPPIRCEGCFNS